MATQSPQRQQSQSSPNASQPPLTSTETEFKPTPEEQSLLDLYITIKSYEKEALRLKEATAKAKLREAEERYNRENQTKLSTKLSSSSPKPSSRKQHKRPKTKKVVDVVGDESYDEDDNNNNDSEEEENLSEVDEDDDDELMNETPRNRQPDEDDAELQEVERARHLAEGGNVDLGPALKKKRTDERGTTSLISNLAGAQTPPYEFSNRLGMSQAGMIVYPKVAEIGFKGWSPPPDASHPCDGDLTVDLPNFDASQAQVGKGTNTLAIKFTAPHESKRFSINIAKPNHQEFFDVLFHFNPRQHQKGGQLVVNDKQEGIWGQGISVPLMTLPMMFGQSSCTLMIQISACGFDVFVEDRHAARLEHRTPLPDGKNTNLILHFPSTDDYGSPECWTVYKVWWGYKPLKAAPDISKVAGVNNPNALHPKKLFISGLTKVTTEVEVELRRAELERSFRAYGKNIIVTVPNNSTFAFVEMESERHADLALHEMQSRYRINRARKTKADVWKEQKLNRKKEEVGEWD